MKAKNEEHVKRLNKRSSGNNSLTRQQANNKLSNDANKENEGNDEFKFRRRHSR